MTGRRLLVAAAALALAFLVPLALPHPARACSCVERQPLAVYAREPGNVIVSGAVEGRDARGVRVAVDRWFAGAAPRPVVWITGDFGNGASCGVGSEPPPGSRWVWVAWTPEPGGDLAISICQPIGDLSTPEGQALLAEAAGTFGGVAPPTLEPEPPAAAPPLDTLPLAAIAIVAILGALVLGGAVLAARRTPSA